MWLPRIAPVRVLLLSSFFVFMLLICQIALVSGTPWLGLDIDHFSNENGLLVVNVYPSSPLQGKVQQGDVLTAISDGVETVIFKEKGVPVDPGQFKNREGSELFLQHQSNIFSMLFARKITLITLKGKRVSTSATTVRTFADSPWRFWATFFMGGLAMLVAVCAWSIKRGDAVLRVFCVGGVFYFIHCSILSLHISRGVAIDPVLYQVLGPISQLSFLVFIHTALALIWYYPKKLREFNILPCLFLWVFGMWLSSYIGIIDMTAEIMLWYFVIFYAVFFFLAVLQRNGSILDLADKKRLYSLCFGVMASGLIFMCLIVVPSYLLGRTLIPVYFMSFSAIFSFIGMSVGIAKTELFGIDNSWFKIWLWFVGGAIFITCDIALIFILGLHDVMALVFTIAFGAWVYFPIRQWIVNRYLRSKFDVEDKFNRLLDMFFTDKDIEEQWVDLLRDTYKPLAINNETTDANGSVGGNFVHGFGRGFDGSVAIKNSGMLLHVPTVRGDAMLQINGVNRGSKLFSRSDRDLTQVMYSLVRKSAELTQEKIHVEEVERERIMRDLHDDVGGKLLTLTHRLKGKDAELARAAMKALRESIYVMDRKSQQYALDLLDELFVEIKERIASTQTALAWDVRIANECILTPREVMNLSRVLQEATTNALKHAFPNLITFTFFTIAEKFIVTVVNDGTVSDPETWEFGKGVHNIRKRVAELGGKADFTRSLDKNNEGAWLICLRITFPLEGML